jgi:daunorubicin resistance ABC transporter ATP-binding subunit
MVEVEDVRKAFGETQALGGVSLTVQAGTILGLLGPNGAGKTTLVRIVATLLVPDSGWARVAGIDVVSDPQGARSVLGLAGQSAAVDELLTGRENLRMVGRLYGLSRDEARRRGDEVLERLGLTEAADRLARTYSGGMRRRLDLGASLVGRPVVLLMDEPTTGLDPRTRIDLWEFIAELVRDGTTLLLTTQYLEEADRLADTIAVIDRGAMIALGSASELKGRVGGDVLEVTASHGADVPRLAELLAGVGSDAPTVDERARRVRVAVANRVRSLSEATRRVEDAEVPVDDIGVRRPSLDDVFLALTGHAAEQADEDGDGAGSPGRRRAGRRR